MTKWENNSLGKAGRFYPLLYLAPLPLIGFSLALFGYAVTGNFQLWERILVAGFGVFFMAYFVRSIEAICVTRSTVQEIEYDGKAFRGKTFSGKSFEVNRLSSIFEDEGFFAKKNIKFLFKDNGNLIIKSGSETYYLSGSMEGISTFRELLEIKRVELRSGKTKGQS